MIPAEAKVRRCSLGCPNEVKPPAQNGSKDAPAVWNGLELSDAKEAISLKARHFRDAKLVTQSPEIEGRINLKPFGIRKVNRVKAIPPQCVVSVAEIRESRPEQQIHQQHETRVSHLAITRHVSRATAGRETTSLDNVGTLHQCGDESRD